MAVRINASGRSAMLSFFVTKKPIANAYTTAIAEPSVAVKAPPTMPPITITGIMKMMIERLSSCSTRAHAKGSPVSGN